MKRFLIILLALLLLLSSCALAYFFIIQAPTVDAGAKLTVHFIDVGQADCALLACGGEYMLIDGGNVADSSLVVSYLEKVGVRELAAVVCSHAHEDHVGGLPAVLAVYPTKAVYAPTNTYSSKVFDDFLYYTDQQRLEITIPAPGDRIDFGGATVTVLGPTKSYADPNNTSIVLMVQFGQAKFLFTGDFAQSGTINNEYRELCANVDVLKFPHHGHEPYEVGKNAMKVIRPQYILVPGAANQYKMWNDYDNIGVKFPKENILTNAEGHVVILTDGGDRFEVLTQQDPADYAPPAN